MPGRQWCFCHSQNPSEKAAGSSKESEKVHVAEGSCPAHKEAVLFFQGGSVCGPRPEDAQWTLGSCPGDTISTTHTTRLLELMN